MAILSALDLSDVEDLRTESTMFANHAGDLQKVTNSMLTTVSESANAWKGVAAQTYQNKFSGLQDEMDKLYKECIKYSENLTQIANNYNKTETDNQGKASTLNDNLGLL